MITITNNNGVAKDLVGRYVTDAQGNVKEISRVYIGDKEVWSNGLPYGYFELEYIENTSDAYIDTQIIPENSELKLETKINFTSTDNSIFCGNYTTTGGITYRQYMLIYDGPSTAVKTAFHSGTNENLCAISASTNTWYNIKSGTDTDVCYLQVNDNTDNARRDTYTEDKPLYIFARNESSAKKNCKCKCRREGR